MTQENFLTCKWSNKLIKTFNWRKRLEIQIKKSTTEPLFHLYVRVICSVFYTIISCIWLRNFWSEWNFNRFGDVKTVLNESHQLKCIQFKHLLHLSNIKFYGLPDQTKKKTRFSMSFLKSLIPSRDIPLFISLFIVRKQLRMTKYTEYSCCLRLLIMKATQLFWYGQHSVCLTI